MTVASIDEATDEMLTVFKDAWDLTGYAAVWSDIPGSVPQTEEPWARVTVRHADGGQTSLANAQGARMFTHTGTLWVQLFVPMGQGGTKGYELAQLVLSAYRSARGAVWYRNHRHREAGKSGAFEQVNCLIDFSYDTIL